MWPIIIVHLHFDTTSISNFVYTTISIIFNSFEKMEIRKYYKGNAVCFIFKLFLIYMHLTNATINNRKNLQLNCLFLFFLRFSFICFYSFSSFNMKCNWQNTNWTNIDRLSKRISVSWTDNINRIINAKFVYWMMLNTFTDIKIHSYLLLQ